MTDATMRDLQRRVTQLEEELRSLRERIFPDLSKPQPPYQPYIGSPVPVKTAAGCTCAPLNEVYCISSGCPRKPLYQAGRSALQEEGQADG